MELAIAHPTTKPDSKKVIVVTVELNNSAAHGDVDDTTNNEWSDRDLQVFDLKAAVTLSSTCVIEAIQFNSIQKTQRETRRTGPNEGRDPGARRQTSYESTDTRDKRVQKSNARADARTPEGTREPRRAFKS